MGIFNEVTYIISSRKDRTSINLIFYNFLINLKSFFVANNMIKYIEQAVY